MQLFVMFRQRYGMLGLLLLWCLALIGYWLFLVRDYLAFAMLWNLFLGVLPVVWSALFQLFVQRKRLIGAGFFFVLWLLFLPNAPYLVTDLIHLATRPAIPLWYVLATLLSCAGTGALLGYHSLSEIHYLVEQRFGRRMGWLMASGSLLLSGFGIYLGRFLRWNSWDAFTHPRALLKSMVGQFLHPGSFPAPIPVTIIFGTGLLVGYIALRSLPLYQKSRA